MTSSHILVFTAAYPYGVGESFFDLELKYLAKAFGQVTLFPMHGTGAARPTPENVVVLKPLWSSKKSRAFLYLRNLATLKCWQYFSAEVLRCLKQRRHALLPLMARVLQWSIYRVSLERSEVVSEFVANRSSQLAYAYWGAIPALAIPKLSKAGVPCVVRFHSGDLYLNSMASSSFLKREAQYFPWREMVLESAARILFISENGLQYCKNNWPSLLLEKCRVSRLAVSSLPIGQDRKYFEDKLVIVSCSSIIPVKRVELIADFVCSLSKYKKVVWHHFGGGQSEDLSQRIQGAGELVETKFWGQVSNADIKSFYADNNIDLFVNFSTREGIPVSIMEAMSFGIPVLATDVGGTSEAVVTGESGLLIGVDEPKEASELAGKVNAALSNGGAISASRPETVWREKFSPDSNYAQLVNDLRMLAFAQPSK